VNHEASPEALLGPSASEQHAEELSARTSAVPLHAATNPKRRACFCPAYHFPHRFGGGLCGTRLRSTRSSGAVARRWPDVIAPRPYQLEGIQRVRVAFAAAPSVVLVLPTGGGKTIIGSWIIKNALEVGTRSLFVAHRVEIIRQTFCKLVRNGIAIEDDRRHHGLDARRRAAPSSSLPTSRSLDDDELWSRFGRRRPARASRSLDRHAPRPPEDARPISSSSTRRTARCRRATSISSRATPAPSCSA
jgi:hypothetical protein